jgi:hypothetical protein
MLAIRTGTLVAAACLLAGCSSGGGGGGPTDEGYTLLQEVNELLRAAAGTIGRPPGKVADLNPHQAMFPRAHAAIKDGAVVVLWGTPFKGEGEVGKDEAVLAYEKNVPTDGGYVLLSAGTVKKMSASEFQSAPKAK